MNLQAYIKYWSDNGEKVYTYLPAQLDNAKVNKDTIVFLTRWGLPVGAAPFLSFSEMQQGRMQTPNQVFKINFEDLDNYLMFGSNGSGDPVCISAVDDEIVYLNHDNYFERVFINQTILQFGLSLINYREFILSLVNLNTTTYVRRKFSDEEFESLKLNFLEIDKASLGNYSFWAAELDGLLWERDNEL
jgi:hypothetical protein